LNILSPSNRIMDSGLSIDKLNFSVSAFPGLLCKDANRNFFFLSCLIINWTVRLQRLQTPSNSTIS
jgi:hypothetical protein